MKTTRYRVSAITCVMLMAVTMHVSAYVGDEEASVSWWNDTPWKDPERGFNWYPDLQAKPKPDEKPREEKPKTIYEMQSLEEIEKEVKRLRGVAIINPTKDNIHQYLKAHDWVFTKSAVFADAARRVVWASPDVNYNNRSPVVTYARQKAGERRAKDQRDTVKDLAATHGIIFFARSDCPYCHDQAPILKLFEQQTGMQVLAVTMDGGRIPNFPEARPDNGISMTVTGGEGVPIVPAVFLVNRESKEAIPLGSGVVAAEELVERIRILTKTKPGDEF